MYVRNPYLIYYYLLLTLFNTTLSFSFCSPDDWWSVHSKRRDVSIHTIKFHKLYLSLRLIVEIFILKLYLICLRKYKEIRWRWFINVILFFEWLINIHEEKVVNVCSISNILFKLPFEEFYIICYIYKNFGSTSILIHVMIVYANAP